MKRKNHDKDVKIGLMRSGLVGFEATTGLPVTYRIASPQIKL
jgi:hypothetical protein